MLDREKVIKGLKCCCSPMTYDCRNRCPYTSLYKPGNGYKNCMAALLPDALALLKEQEPKTILGIADSIEGIEVGKCPRCERTILNKQSDPTWYCKYCGQAVKWE